MRHSSSAAAPNARAVVEIGPRVPTAVPGLALHGDLQRVCVHGPFFRARGLVARRGQRREGRQRGVKEPSEPDAFALALLTDAVHAIVPVPRPHQRKPVPAQREACIQRKRAMLEQRRSIFGDRRQEEIVRLVRRQWGPFEERNGFIEHERVSRRLDILRDRIGEPRAVVGNSGADALAGMGQPPVLHVAVDELPRRSAKQMLARQIGTSGGERHAILQLVAKAIGAAGLIEGGARPDTAGERLIEQPAVEHDVHRPIGSLDDDSAQRGLPKARNSRFDRVEIDGPI